MSTCLTILNLLLPLAAAETPSQPAQPPSAQSEVAAIASDGTVAGGARALAEAIARSFRETGRQPAFHRVAISAFAELGSDAADHKLGRVLAELISVELSQRPPFVVVERDHLEQIMREHRLADLGVVDASTAAQFGKILGAESLVSGTVSALGATYVVTIKQVDVETGRLLVAGKVSFAAAGLVALSEDAVVLRSRTDALFRSAVVPGWGQLYNREPVKGVAFLVAAAGALGTAGAFYIAANSAHSSYQQNTPDVVGDLQTANDRIAVANACLIGLGVVWVINLADAYLSGEDATSVEIPESFSGDSDAAAISF
jgi:TolB-like protein